jgi:hypothetical protein
MKRTIQGLIVIALGALAFGKAGAQLQVGGDLLSNCGQIDGHRDAGNLPQAREAARLCLQGLDQLLEGEVGQYFLMEVAGWVRTSFEQNSVMGFNNTTAEYQKNGNTAMVSLTGDAGGGGGLLGAFGGLASLGMMQAGQQVTVAGLSAVVTPDGMIIVTLGNGAFLSFSCSAFTTAAAALAGIGDLVDAFPVAQVNETLVDG